MGTAPLEIIRLSEKVESYYLNDNAEDARDYLIQIYESVKQEPEQLKEVKNFYILGKAFTLMLCAQLTDEVDVLQMISSVGYLCASKGIQPNLKPGESLLKDRLNNIANTNSYKDRLIILQMGHDPFRYTVMEAVGLMSNILTEGMQPGEIKARDAIYKMEFADLELNPIIYQRIDDFSNRRIMLNSKIMQGLFLPDKTKEEVIKSGNENHRLVTEYLENRIIVEADIDF